MTTTIEQRKQLLKGLNPQQRVAVKDTLKEPTLVITGAGSGKTRVLTTRIAYLIAKGVDPRHIMAVTFTNKAANEMKERIGKLVGPDSTKKLTIGTFHSLCVRWLHRFYAEAGLKKNWTIYDEDDQNKVIRSVLKDFNLESNATAVRIYKDRISNCKNEMMTPEDARNHILYDKDHTFYKVYKEYQDKLQRLNAMDFDDLLMRMVHVLEMYPDVRRKFQKKFKYIMVDEYQDTNECQYRIVKQIVGKANNIFIVGDDYQSIYGWRGADVQKILNFQRDYPGAKIVKLEQNYRSTQTIVEAGNKLMENAQNQMKKTCFSNNSVGDKIRKFSARTDMEEAEFVAQEINNLVRFESYSYGDFAILYRTNVQSRLFEEKLMIHQIPYNMVSGFSFYERKEIKDILAWLQLAINPDNDIACERVLGMLPGIGKTTIEAIVSKQRKENSSLYEAVEYFKPKTVKAQAAIAGLTQIVVRLNTIYEAGKHVTDTPISDMLDLVFKHTGYVDKLKEEGSEESERRVDNIMELVKIAKGYEEENNHPTVQDFLDQIALTAQADKVSAKQDADKVQMMTLHTAKGLEFPVVFLVGFEEGLLPHASAVEEGDIAEERRLAYVGITRAEKLLYITMARQRMNYQRLWETKSPSRFLYTIPDSLIEEV